MRPVFLRIEFTFESSFLGSVVLFCVVVVDGLADVFFVAADVGALVGSGFGSSVAVGTASLISVAGGGSGAGPACGGLVIGAVSETPVDGAADCTPRCVVTK